MWLGPAPYTPYTQDRCSNKLWWFISDYALGFIAGWGVHPLDIALWGGGDKVTCPVEIEGKGVWPKVQPEADQAILDSDATIRCQWIGNLIPACLLAIEPEPKGA